MRIALCCGCSAAVRRTRLQTAVAPEALLPQCASTRSGLNTLTMCALSRDRATAQTCRCRWLALERSAAQHTRRRQCRAVGWTQWAHAAPHCTANTAKLRLGSLRTLWRRRAHARKHRPVPSRPIPSHRVPPRPHSQALCHCIGVQCFGTAEPPERQRIAALMDERTRLNVAAAEAARALAVRLGQAG